MCYDKITKNQQNYVETASFTVEKFRNRSEGKMNEQVIGIVILALCVVLYPLSHQMPNITEAKYVDFSKVFR